MSTQNIKHFTATYEIELNSCLTVAVKREDLTGNMATWTLTDVWCDFPYKADPVQMLLAEYDFGEYDIWSLDYVMDEKIKPFLRSYFADAFGPFVNDGAF